MKIAHPVQGWVYDPRWVESRRDERSSRVLSTFSFALWGLDSFCLITQGGARFTRLPWAIFMRPFGAKYGPAGLSQIWLRRSVLALVRGW
jgi:hypothetical protein